MAHVLYHRDDCFIALRRTADGGAAVSLATRDAPVATQTFPGPEVEIWHQSWPAVETGAYPGGLSDFLRPFAGVVAATGRATGAGTNEGPRIHRLVLTIDDPHLAALPWEGFVEQLWESTWEQGSRPLLVRATPVHFVVGALPLKLPLSIAEVGDQEECELSKLILPIFGTHEPARVARALVMSGPATQGDLIRWTRSHSVDATRHIVHIWQPQFPDRTEDISLTTTPERPGTLGWAMELARAMATRLFVFVCHDTVQEAKARQLAASIIARGGPAVVVYPSARARHDDLHFFYSQLIHNAPLDQAVQWAGIGAPQAITLFAGAGREESLRFTRFGEALSSAARRLLAPADTGDAWSAAKEAGLILRLHDAPVPGQQWWPRLLPQNLAGFQFKALADFVDAWPKFRFEEHEGEGLLPLADSLVRLYSGLFPEIGPRTQQQQARRPEPQGPPPPRYVNSSLWEAAPDGQLVQTNQKSAALSLDTIVHLRVAIGAHDVSVQTVGALPIAETAFSWTPEIKGVWLEVAVTDLDFEVWGDPVRQLWLPQEGETEAIYFAVRPRVAPVSRLRLCIYYRQNVIQSFRLAVMTKREADADAPRDRRKLLAKALALPKKHVPDVGYLPRLEYSLGQSTDHWTSRPGRALSIVANDLDGVTVISAKAEDTFAVSAPGNVSDDVDAVRTALRQTGTETFQTGDTYRFGTGGDPNRGTTTDLETALKLLAAKGRRLYVQLFPDVDRQKEIERALAEPGVIHVAHVLVEKVLPWAALYGRHYDANRKKDGAGNPVVHEACTAVIGEPEERLLKTKCGEHPNCLLHPQQLTSRAQAGQPAVLPETVACPLQFWGFRHLIEIPAQQATPSGAPPPDQQDWISAEKPVNAVAGFHLGLRLVDEHRKKLEDLFTAPLASLRSQSDRDTVLALLDDETIDLAYFYCHARGGEVEGKRLDEILELQEAPSAQPGQIAPGDFGPVEWKHKPLVIINGCHTAGFSPRALSPFVRVFMGRKASGVIGTEIDVWEPFASEFARLFLKAFLGGASAGEAMRQARLQMLSINNPLGLVYTLFAGAQLRLKKPT